MTATDVRNRLQGLSSEEVAQSAARFFKTGPGQYAEGDMFIGVRVPVLRKLVREFRDLPLTEIEVLLHSPIHEERHLALLILVQRVSRAEDKQKKIVFDLYLQNTHFINNWDLVDCSAPAIVGGYLVDKSRKKLVQLAKSERLWERRMAIIATQHFIRLNQFDDTRTICLLLLSDKEDLIHKAAGWMLREAGERDEAFLKTFLDQHAPVMPRTMLRYAIEHLSKVERQTYLLADHPLNKKNKGA